MFNIGGVEEISILELARRIKKICHSNAEIKFIPFEKAYQNKNFEDMTRRVPAIDKARRIIGFNPNDCVDSILERIVENAKKKNSA